MTSKTGQVVALFGDDRCQELASPDIANFSFSVFILLGILISYLPQHWKIISRRSSEGLSPMFVLLGTVSGTASLANILSLPASQQDMGCCSTISGFACAAALLGVAQIFVQWTCFFAILMLFLIFFPRRGSDPYEPDLPTFREALAVLGFSVVFFVATFISTLVFSYRFPEHLQQWAEFIGVLGTCLAAAQYLPQIYTTWKMKHVMSLSITMMLIQTPGSFVWAGSLAKRLGPSGWSSWGLFCVTGTLQGVLLLMAISFALRDRKQERSDAAKGPNHGSHVTASGPEADERTALLNE